MSSNKDDAASKIAGQQLGGLLGTPRPKVDRREPAGDYESEFGQRNERPDLLADVRAVKNLMSGKRGAGSTRVASGWDEDISHLRGDAAPKAKVPVVDSSLFESSMVIVKPEFERGTGSIGDCYVYRRHHMSALALAVFHVVLDAMDKQHIRMNPTSIKYLRDVMQGAVKLGVIGADRIDPRTGELTPIEVEDA